MSLPKILTPQKRLFWGPGPLLHRFEPIHWRVQGFLGWVPTTKTRRFFLPPKKIVDSRAFFEVFAHSVTLFYQFLLCVVEEMETGDPESRWTRSDGFSSWRSSTENPPPTGTSPLKYGWKWSGLMKTHWFPEYKGGSQSRLLLGQGYVARAGGKG